MCTVRFFDRVLVPYKWFSPDVTAAMLVYRTIEKKVFREIDSIIMQNMSHNLLLFCTQTWPSRHEIQNHLYLLGNRMTWPQTVKPHLTTPFRLCIACALEQSSILIIYLEPLGARSQASLSRIKLLITVCQLLPKRNTPFFFLFFHSLDIGSRYC